MSRSLFKTASPCMLGLAFVHMWIYCSTHRFLDSGGVSVTAVLYSAMSVALVGLGVLLWRRPKTASGARTSAGDPAPLAPDLAAAVLMAIGGVALSVPLPVSPSAAIACGAALGGLGVAWAYGRWVQTYARVGLKTACAMLFLTMVVGSTCKTLIDFLPSLAAGPVFACLPFATFACVRYADAHVERGPEPDRYYTRRTIGSLGRAVASVAAFSFVIGVLRTTLLETAPEPYALSVIANHGTEVAIALFLLWWVGVAGRGIDFGRTWRLILIIMVTVLVFEPLVMSPAERTVLLALVRTAHALLVVFFLFLAVADVARHSSYEPLAVYAAGWLAYTLPFAAGSAAGIALASSPAAPFVTSTAAWALVVIALVLLDDRSLGNQLIFAELGGAAEDDSPTARAMAAQRALAGGAAGADARGEVAGAGSLHERCAELARANSLTAREAEVFELLVRGHSKTRIAETFLISENTVRGHAKHIYAKLGVHSKQEMLDLVEGAQRTSAREGR